MEIAYDEPMKILLVEDDEILVASLAADLTSQNYTVETVMDGRLGRDYAQAAEFDIIVLDVNLPGLDGISLCKQLRQSSYKGAILLLTAERDSQYKIAGLDAGADDYVVKPCPTDELSARIRALLRRPREITSPVLRWGWLQLDPSTRQVSYAEKQVSLSPKEYGLLELFLRNPQRVFSSTILLERLWGFDEMPGEETIRTHIKRLRRKLKKAGVSEAIENIYGMGYRLMPPPNDALSTQGPELPAEAAAPDDVPRAHQETGSPSDVPPSPGAENEDSAHPRVANTQAESLKEAARAAAAAALGQFKGVIWERLEILAAAATALQAASLTEELREQAHQVAHKLVGSLGMFGLTEGSRLSQKIEAGFRNLSADNNRDQLHLWVSQLQRDLSQLLEAPLQPPDHEATDTMERFSGGKRTRRLPTLMVVSTAEQLVEALAESARGQLRVISCDTLSSAQEQILQTSPDLMLLDVVAFADEEKPLQLMANLANIAQNLSVLALTAQEDFQKRLDISRRCRCKFLPRSLPSLDIIQAVLQTWHHEHAMTFRVLVVDDDPAVLSTLQERLPRWGIEVDTLADPRQLWQSLPKLKPDLLMLDIEMPHVEGTELCQIIRSDHDWNRLPILFLSARQDAETIRKVYSVGADDYLAKPFTEPELVTRILNRLERHGIAAAARAV